MAASSVIDPSPAHRAPRAPEARPVTLLLVGRILGPHGDGLCRIRTVSAWGLTAEVRASFAIGEKVRIELRSGHALLGEISSAKPGMIDVRFDAPITDLKQFLAGQRSGQRRPGSQVTRSPRLPADCSADILVDGWHHHGVATDISQNGVRLVTTAPLSRDKLLSVAIAGLPPLRAVVRWCAEDGAGVAFLDPLAFAVLAEWAEDPALRYNRRQGA